MRLLNIVLPRHNSYSWPTVEVIWPSFWNLAIISIPNSNGGVVCVFTSEHTFFSLPLHSRNAIFVDESLRRLFFSPLPSSPHLVSSFRVIEQFMAPVLRFFIIKLKFRGKGFYLYRNARNVLRFRFGFSHRVNRYFFNSNVRLTSKTSLILSGLRYEDVHLNAVTVWSVRPINVYTGKGIRFNRQIVYRKPGKMSTYR